ncbi:hypothetical protein O6H91_09G034600 [Diphasiastrum complanatum]|uniref:Uncharacterized protein n=1 Tax=Diphasiastrum complanatum TaxID=34168 RepID=A0ACC2CN44_DIPCM|nr:hypothetical protein O6H91_09G034600 [Diphasiastrum complanatum]
MICLDRMSGLKQASKVFCLCCRFDKASDVLRLSSWPQQQSFLSGRLFSRTMASHGNRMRGRDRTQQWRGQSKESGSFHNFSEVPISRATLDTDNAAAKTAQHGTSTGGNIDSFGTASASASHSTGAGSLVDGIGSSSLKSIWVPKASMSSSVVEPLTTVEPEPLVDISKSPNIPQGGSGLRKGGMHAKAQPRATFYPKFENEKSDQEIRLKIIEVVSSGKGVLEVSLKHSGSLFMYAGDNGGAFAKNSYGNLYTAVGVFVLGQTLQEAWREQAPKKQQELNLFLQKNNMCIAMELVTAVLDDHGQRPLQDYVVVTAVTELRSRPRFYSTPDLIAFCREWRLPTNHIWLFSSRSSASSVFAAYDALCEEGIASSVSKTLDEIADASISATRSHVEVQGEILEGLVARVVSPHSVERLSSVLKEFPLVKPDEGFPSLGPGLREICAANKQSEEQLIKTLLESVGRDFCADWSDWTHKDATDNNLFGSFLQASPRDDTTSKLQEMFRLIRQRKLPVRFRSRLISHGEDSDNDLTHFKTTVHVLADSAFRRYQKEMRHHPGLWPLYRGFFVEVTLSKHGKALTSVSQEVDDLTNKISHLSGIQLDMMADEDANLMLKLKFLPYKLRTFLIRNGLTTLFTKGLLAYKEYYSRLMKSWGTSAVKQQELSHLLNEWAKYITSKTKGKKLNSSTYLSEAEMFLKHYAERSPKNMRLVGAAGTLIDTHDFILTKHVEEEEEEIDYPKEDGSAVDIDLEHPLLEKTSKAKGMLVFFPGIPGCAKSALCKEILGSPDGLGDGRQVKSLMGDEIKGRYWQILRDDRRKKPSVITLADKNAPNVEVWKQIEDICQRTDAIAVPIVPDSEESNPFSLDALAVFIYRVLQRVGHPGNLDKNSPNPGYVLLMFYKLYEGKDRQEFEAELLERFGYLVKMPLLKTDRPHLPSSVHNVLTEGLALYKRHTAKHGKLESSKGSFKNDWARWEENLKNIFFSNAEYLDVIQVPFQEAVSVVKTHLHEIAIGNYGLHVPGSSEERSFHSFTFAAISLSTKEILSILYKVANIDTKAKEYLQDKNLEETLKEIHLTLAHKRAHGVASVASYAMWRGSNVPVQFTAFLFSEKMCALEASLHSTGGITSRNSWPHVTVWTSKGTPAKEANSLPDLVSSGQATRTELMEPVTISGVVQFL